MENKGIKNRIRGSLIGGAIGDALGYPVEFLPYGSILRKYGRMGITRYDTTQWWSEDSSNNGIAVISDDTQMTLFTACGILNAKKTDTDIIPSVCEAYIEWLFTQTNRNKEGFDKCWIRELPELNVRRAPGNTCITALNSILTGYEPCNNSKGCGGVMRIAPIPLYGVVENRIDIKKVCCLAADAAALTHQHPSAYISSFFVAYIIYRLIQSESTEREMYKEYIREGLALIVEMYPKYDDEVVQFCRLIKTAILLSDISTDDVRTIENEIGGGWVAEETVAIAIYCSLAYFDNFERAIIAAVNHSGDSDSTGAITGNILGAVIGYENLPWFYKKNLELHDVILHIADDLFKGEESKLND